MLAVSAMVSPVFADTKAAQQAALQSQLDQLNQQIAQNQKTLSLQQQQRATLERDVSILDSQIKVAKLQIKQRDLSIQSNKDAIARSQAGIAQLDSKVAAGEESLAQIIRDTNEIDRTAFIEILLNDSLSEAMRDLDDFAKIHQSLEESFTQMAVQRSDLTARKQALEDQNQKLAGRDVVIRFLVATVLVLALSHRPGSKPSGLASVQCTSGLGAASAPITVERVVMQQKVAV
mgnify:CR=1 FL=1